MSKGERLMQVVLVPPTEAVGEKAKDLKKLDFKKGATVNVNAEGAVPKGWELTSGLTVTLWRRRSRKGDQFSAEATGMDGVRGYKYRKSPRKAIKDLFKDAVEVRGEYQGDELQDIGPALVGTVAGLRAKLQPRSFRVTSIKT